MKCLNTTATSASRREFLLAAAASGMAFASPLRSFAQPTAPKAVAASQQNDLGLGQNPTCDAPLKFHPDGTVKPFAGNTVICHIPQQCRFRDGTVMLHDDLARSSFAHRLGILPPESCHMTIYPGNAVERIVSETPVLELGLPEYCTFRDMDRFDPERILRVG
jgi:hypothetical protein